MRSLLFLTLLLLVGCAKKAEPYKRQVGDDAPAATPTPDTPKAEAAKKKDADEKPSWIKPKPEGRELPVEAGTGKPPWVQNPPPVPAPGIGQIPLPPPPGAGTGQPMPPMGGTQPPLNPQPMGTVPPPATGTPTTPAGKVVTRADMNEVWIFMENASVVSGKLPPPELVYPALVKEKAAAGDLVKSNDIILTGAKTRESVWAFERKAPTQGGWIAGHNGPEQVTAAEFARRIRQ